jgi:hypothetical protein
MVDILKLRNSKIKYAETWINYPPPQPEGVHIVSIAHRTYGVNIFKFKVVYIITDKYGAYVTAGLDRYCTSSILN